MTAFIWDLDGTLIDSYGAFMEALEEVFARYDLTFDKEKVYNFIKTKSVNAFLQQQAADFEALKSAFTAASSARNAEVTVLPGAREILDWAKQKGIRNFVYTHKGQNAYPLLEQLGLLEAFEEVVTSHNGFPRKPHPAGVDYLLDKYNLDKATTFYIGDRSLDIEVAKNAGVQSINFLPAENSWQIDQLTDIENLSIFS